MIFGRETYVKLPDFQRKAQITDKEGGRKELQKVKDKQYNDEKRRAKNSGTEPGNQVLSKVEKTNKRSCPDLLVVVKKGEGEAALRSDQGVEIKRNASFIRVNNTANDKVATELWKIRERS